VSEDGGKVLPFKPAPVKGTQPRVIDRPRFHCQGDTCRQNDQFWLMLDGTVACARCGKTIMNLKAVEVK
jgi:hypothetical protein